MFKPNEETIKKAVRTTTAPNKGTTINNKNFLDISQDKKNNTRTIGRIYACLLIFFEGKTTDKECIESILKVLKK